MSKPIPRITFDAALRVFRAGDTTLPNAHAAIQMLTSHGVTHTEAADLVRAAQAATTPDRPEVDA